MCTSDPALSAPPFHAFFVVQPALSASAFTTDHSRDGSHGEVA